MIGLWWTCLFIYLTRHLIKVVPSIFSSTKVIFKMPVPQMQTLQIQFTLNYGRIFSVSIGSAWDKISIESWETLICKHFICKNHDITMEQSQDMNSLDDDVKTCGMWTDRHHNSVCQSILTSWLTLQCVSSMDLFMRQLDCLPHWPSLVLEILPSQKLQYLFPASYTYSIQEQDISGHIAQS